MEGGRVGKDILFDTLSMALAKRAPFSGFLACQVYIGIPQLEFLLSLAGLCSWDQE